MIRTCFVTMVRVFFYLLPATAALLLAACGGSSEPIEITDVRELDPENTFEQPVIAESDKQRFPRLTAGGEDMAGGGESSDASTTLDWVVPDGWTEVPATRFRDINLRFGEQSEGECYMTRGMQGDLAGNVNRWRKQVGLEALTAEEIAELPTLSLFGRPATVVSVDGPYTGMGSKPISDARLHGAILSVGGATVTVKMVGPKSLVAENEGKFDEFCASLSLKGQ